MVKPAFQDLIPNNFCFGCGPQNVEGLRIKSHWAGEDAAVATFCPAPHHNAGAVQFTNGGIIATLIDCHCVCTAAAEAYRREGREIGSDPEIWYVTGQLNITYLKPTPLNAPIEAHATVASLGPKKTKLICSVRSNGVECATAEVIAIRVPSSWKESKVAP